jgi:excisionase family DNA binding protein
MSELLTYAEAGEALGVTARTIFRLVNRGVVPVVRLSRKLVRIRRLDLDALVLARTERRLGRAAS